MKLDISKVRSFAREAAIALLLFFFISLGVNYLRKPASSPANLPRMEMTLIDGTEYHAPKGKPLIIHFWGSWCPVCRTELSNIQSISKRYELLSIAVNSGSDEKIRSFMKKNGADFRVLNDRDGKWADRFGVSVFPTTFIYDADGKERFVEVGYTTTAGLTARMAIVE